MKVFDRFEFPELNKYHPLKMQVRYYKILNKNSRSCGRLFLIIASFAKWFSVLKPM